MIFAVPCIIEAAFVENNHPKTRGLESPLSPGPPPLSTPTDVRPYSSFDRCVTPPGANNETIHLLEARNEWMTKHLENRNAIIEAIQRTIRKKDKEIQLLKAHCIAMVGTRDAEIARLRSLLICLPAEIVFQQAPQPASPPPPKMFDPPPAAPGRYKTKLCKSFMKGRETNGDLGCVFGESCLFAHGEGELRRPFT